MDKDFVLDIAAYIFKRVITHLITKYIDKKFR